MTQGVEKSGKTVEEAVKEALECLGLPPEKVDVEILEEPSRGILGLVGQRPARVRVIPREDLSDRVRGFLEDLLEHMGFSNARVKSQMDEEVLRLDVEGDDIAALIGRRGATLDAVQYLVNLVAGRLARETGSERVARERLRIIVDASGYRERRARSLERLARSVADRVLRDGKEVSLEPMNPMERRIVHLAVQECERVESYSEGEEPFRHVVISRKKE